MYTSSRAEPGVIEALAFGTLSPDDIRKLSQREVTSVTLVKRREPVDDGPNSPFFGTEDPNLPCKTCGGVPLGKCACEGHFGHIELAVPVYKPDWVHINFLVRKCICYYCTGELFDRSSPQMKQILKTTNEYSRLQAIALVMENKNAQNKLMCGKPGTVFSFRDVVVRGMPCGAYQPKWRHLGMRILPDFDNVPHQPHLGPRVAFTSRIDWQGQSNITPRTARFLGFNTRLTHPGNLIITVLPVPPICIRPSTDIHQHDFTTQLMMIQKLNVAMKSVQRSMQRWQEIRGPLSVEEKERLRVDTERFYNAAVAKYQTLTGIAANGTTGVGKGNSTATIQNGGARSQHAHGPQQLQHAAVQGRPGAGGKAGAYSRRASSLNGLRRTLGSIETMLEQAKESKEAVLAAARTSLVAFAAANSREPDLSDKAILAHAVASSTTASVGGGPFDDVTGTLKTVGMMLAEYAAEVHMELQYAVWTYFDNTVKGVRPDLQKNGQPYSFLIQRYHGKGNRIRINMQGKRCNFNARSVITPSPLLAVDEMSYPRAFAAVQIQPETITPLSKMNMTAKLIAGQVSMIVLPEGTPIDVNIKSNPAALVLQDNWQVECHKHDGALIWANRQPSLHRMSIMAHKAVLHDGPNFRLSQAATTPYNADFDGDEINISDPHSKLAQAEAREIGAVDKHTLNPKDGSATMFLVQDAVLGSYLMSRKDVFFTWQQAQRLLAARRSSAHHPEWTLYRRSRKSGKRVFRWTGCAIWSALFPKHVVANSWGYDGHGDNGLLSDYKLPKSLQSKEKDSPHSREAAVVLPEGLLELKRWEDLGLVRNSQLLCGRYIKSKGKMFVRLLTKQDTGQTSCDWMTDAQLMTNLYLSKAGCSITLSDIAYSHGEIKQVLLERVFAWAKQFEGRVQPASIEEKNLMEVCRHLQAVLGDQHHKTLPGTKPALEPYFVVPPPRDGYFENTNSSSKGDKFNRTQVSVMQGQQYISGSPVKNPLTHFHPVLEDNLTSHGLVKHGLGEGLQAHEYFYHAQAGRETLTDTSNKTPECGYITRRLVKLMESLQIAQDGSVRDAAGNIYLTRYGTDGYDGIFMESVRIRTVLLDNAQLMQRYDGRHVPTSCMTPAAHHRAVQQDPRLCIDEMRLVQDQRDEFRAIQHRISSQRLTEEVRCAIPFSRLVTDALTRRGPRNSDYQVDWTPAEAIQLLADFERHLEEERLLWCPIDVNELMTDNKQEEEEKENNDTEHHLAHQKALKRLAATIAHKHSQYFRILLHDWLAPAFVIGVYRLERHEFKALLLDVETQLATALAPPGEMVGPIAAQSIGEPSTQMTLNTFHYAGSDNVLGVPRLKEIIGAVTADKMQRATMTVYLAQKRRGFILRDPEGAAHALAASLPIVYFSDLVTKWTVVDEIDRSDDGWFVDVQEALLPDTQRGFLSRLAIRFELDKLACARRGLTPSFIASLVHHRCFAQPVHHWTSSPTASEHWVLRLRLNTRAQKYTQLVQLSQQSKWYRMRQQQQQQQQQQGQATAVPQLGATSVPGNSIELMAQFKNLAQHMLSSVHVHGLRGVQRATAVQVPRTVIDSATGAVMEEKEWIVETVGANFEAVLRHPWVCFKRTRTSDIIGVANALGIEAGTRAIVEEILAIMKAHGIEVDARHAYLIAEVMNHMGVVSAMTRFGAIHNTPSLVLHSSFEETGPKLSKGAAFGQFDAMAGPSERLMIGREVHMGTGTVHLEQVPVPPEHALEAERYWRDFQLRQRAMKLPEEHVTMSSLLPFRAAPGQSAVVVSSMYDILLARANIIPTLQNMPVRPTSWEGYGMNLSTLTTLVLDEEATPTENAKENDNDIDLEANVMKWRSSGGGDQDKLAKDGVVLGVLHKCPTCKINDCKGRQCSRCHKEMKLAKYMDKQERDKRKVKRHARMRPAASALSTLSSSATAASSAAASSLSSHQLVFEEAIPEGMEEEEEETAVLEWEEEVEVGGRSALYAPHSPDYEPPDDGPGPLTVPDDELPSHQDKKQARAAE